MSLKDFHLIFIICSIILSFFFGAWTIQQYSPQPSFGLILTTLLSFLIGLGLTVYGVTFFKKSKGY